ncbi:hypothetical protein F3Y22_tig00111088pilonHSYRG00141 [Hibiscus syriacus]|uniref:Integrase catalytic domain-containing protein n=1 Tax=Hibiscus syriacus TaxID=106335 RepID=A0A6A2Z3D3_HIBSY|nr:hypothetical protein F3Y22_tig00111088pilonHSYRG00141 [Hibiscus syriacus]
MAMAKTSAIILLLCSLTSLVSISKAETCSNYSFPSNQVFDSCMDLPVLQASLHWNYSQLTTKYDRLLDFSHKLPVSDISAEYADKQMIVFGMLGPLGNQTSFNHVWQGGSTVSDNIPQGINPMSPEMTGTCALVAFLDPNSGQLVLLPYILDPSVKLQKSLLLSRLLDIHLISSATLYGGKMATIHNGATVKLVPNNTKIHHVWNRGLYVQGYSPTIHPTTSNELSSKTTFDVLSGSAAKQHNNMDMMKLVHGILNAISWGILLPMGALSAFFLGTVGFAIGIRMGKNSPGVTYGLHRKLGFAAFCLGALQTLALCHGGRGKTRGRRRRTRDEAREEHGGIKVITQQIQQTGPADTGGAKEAQQQPNSCYDNRIEFAALQKQLEDLTALVKQSHDETKIPKWWENQEERIIAVESRMATNQGFTYKPDEPGILKSKPNELPTHITSFKNGIQVGENSVVKNNTVGLDMDRRGTGGSCNTSGIMLHRPKIELPFFEGSNPRGWIHKCLKYFSLCSIAEEQRVEVATMYLTGKAEIWFDGYIMQKHHVTWHEFEADLCHRFCDKVFADIVEEFTKLVQKGFVKEYQDRFEELQPHMLLQNPTLGEEFFVPLFIIGLRDDIKHRVKALDPKTLSEACRQAKLYELSVEFENKRMRPVFRNPPYLNSLPVSKPTQLPIPQKNSTTLPPKQNLMEYRRQNNLCFKCGEKFVPGHQFIQEEESLEISMNVITGCIGHNTLRIQGSILGKPLNILIDSGSTHSFLTPQWAEAGIQLGGSDMVLGVDWMKLFSPILMDFNKMTLSFVHQDGQIVIQEASKPIPAAIQSLLESYKDIFEEPRGLPPVRNHDHGISLKPDSIPVNLRPYRFPHNQKAEVERQIATMLSSSIIQPSKSPFASPCLLIKKKDGSWRFCVDYRQLNNMTIKYKFPIPVVEDLLDELHGAVYFSKIDLKSGYWQIRIKDAYIHKTAFRTHQGHYEFKVMSFGLTNAPATFQALMNELFSSFLRKFMLVFFDDILVYSSSMAAHIAHLQQVLEVLQANQLFAKFSKCFFGQTQVEYLGHIISAAGVAIDPVRPLTQMFKADNFKWTTAALTAFENLKKAMSTALVLALPDFTQNFYLETDASSGEVDHYNSKERIDQAFGVGLYYTVQEVEASYKEDLLATEWITKLAVHSTADNKWRYSKGILRYKDRVYIGEAGSLRLQILQTLHDSPHGGHSGSQATYQRIKSYFYWPRLKAMVVNYVKICAVCQQTKVEHVAKPGLLQPLPILQQAWEVITMDFFEGLPTSLRKNCILVVVDKFTKYSHFLDLSHPYSAAEVAKLYLDHIYKLHGQPKMAISDRDKTFTSLFWRELIKLLGTKTLFSTAYHPKMDGQTERVNRCLEQYLRGLCFYQPKQWAKLLPHVEWWYNSTYHNTLKLTPF